MSDSLHEAPETRGGSTILSLSLLAVAVSILSYIFFDGFIEMEYRWATKEEYSHGYMIPVVAAFLFYQKLPILLGLDWRKSWLGPVLMVGALLGWFLGEMSSLFIIVHYSFLFSLVALALSMLGWSGFRVTWAAFAYLIFMIPLPTFLYNGLSQKLQLISTEIGVEVIRLFDISVYVTGNVIDLGSYQLQVVEACSGLRYLFPLMSFGFLIAYIYSGPNWHKWAIFLSTIVITILMNSFRIGVIGVTVEYWGVEMADGFLHDFEGWFVFMASLGVLFIVILVLNYASGRRASPIDLIDLTYPSLSELRSTPRGSRQSNATLLVSVVLLVVVLPLRHVIVERTEFTPDRMSFSRFPLVYGSWVGRETALEPSILERLDYPDYIQANYQQSSGTVPVNLYVAYYESQRTGSSIHSPRSCIPGGGWKIADLTQEELGIPLGLGQFEVNRLVISKGENAQLVYYWFDQRGRVITNEYLAKWYLFLDGLTMQRSDGALVRLVTPVLPDTDISEADARLQNFLQDFYPIFADYLPGDAAEAAE